MNVEAQLLELCKDFIDVLELLKDRDCITEEEYCNLAKDKLKFIESHFDSVYL